MGKDKGKGRKRRAEPTGIRRSGRARKAVDYAHQERVELFVAGEDDGRPTTTTSKYNPKPSPAGTSFVSSLTLPDTSGRPRDAHGCLVFHDHPEFRPNLSPQQMIASGVFGGCYFHPKGGKKGVKYPKGIPASMLSHKEYPREWFAGLPAAMYISRRYEIATNKYKVKAGQDQAYWEEKGWIHPLDPRGWFQWYTRFFQGRRTEDDQRQISRWRGVTGAKGRWKRFLLNKIVNANAALDDTSVSPVVRQTLLHWAYEVTERDLERHLKGK
ncbi:hypothetical protein HOP50_07g49610 [Chloropicon primus]|uniref:Uncharacterized protein n=1 Tax=Chloropicon primus TaxID=1764295 RepID=A0A5B8MQ01_9CHLO|nr:hypothetical protein A3770_07p49390 [Chloropicon primus]UPR01639.1 hypothetical protein HOP50_07g49610 [Chloropicon primus]|mmetsp:Transcript_5934/g.17845  ORF Transcript_5934/g.17845 Transcript_5934/m.17845 type:complete len:270 (+) Transcript_5934:205-1014(+)|eukprot:QDZ22421.1 hypothetical protein A3770_07p49390 [Chloropicon primus]